MWVFLREEEKKMIWIANGIKILNDYNDYLDYFRVNGIWSIISQMLY